METFDYQIPTEWHSLISIKYLCYAADNMPSCDPITVDNYAFLFGCMAVRRVYYSMTARHKTLIHRLGA